VAGRGIDAAADCKTERDIVVNRFDAVPHAV
jgi:hypothetical protein